jgi:hypothetical protein
MASMLACGINERFEGEDRFTPLSVTSPGQSP